jgi:hypothetical protein
MTTGAFRMGREELLVLFEGRTGHNAQAGLRKGSHH